MEKPGNFSPSLTRDVEGVVDRFTWVAGAGEAFVVDALGGAEGDGAPR